MKTKGTLYIILSMTLSFLFLVYAPFELLINNTYDLWYNIYDIMKHMIPLFLVSSFALTFLCVVIDRLSRKVGTVILAGAFIVLLSSYIQGTFFSGALPALDGRSIVWNDSLQRITSVVLFIAVSAAVVFLVYKTGSENFEKIVKYVSGFILGMLLVSLVILVVDSESYKKKDVLLPSDAELFNMSEEENFIIFLLDAVDAEAYQTVCEVHPEYKEQFEDFTVFNNVISGYPYTSRSIPFILSGKWYENKGEFSDYCEQVFKESSFFKRLDGLGYRKGFYCNDFWYIKCLKDLFVNISGTYDFKYPEKFVKMQIMMAGYRYFPYDLKRFCVLTPDDFYVDTLKTNGLGKEYDIDDDVFNERLAKSEITSSEEKCFKFIYIRGAHEPFHYPSQCKEIADNSYLSSVEKCMSIAENYIQKLKNADVYENSVIIFMADHGYVEDDIAFGRQNPLLMVKGRNEKHDYLESDLPISHEFLQGAYEKLLNGSSAEEAFTYGENYEPRRFLFYEFLRERFIQEYYQYGYASDEKTMKETGNTYVLGE